MAAENVATLQARLETLARAREIEEAAKEYAFISDAIPASEIMTLPVKVVVPSQKLPPVELFKSIKIAYVFGRLGHVDAAIRLAGTIQLAQERYGTKLVFAYPKHLWDADRAFLNKLGIWLPSGGAERFIESTDEAFNAYFTEYSVGSDEWTDYELQNGADVLGKMGYDPAAFRTRGESNVVYVVPYNLPKQARADALFNSLHSAVATREHATPDRVPEFLASVTLGEHEKQIREDAELAARTLKEKMDEVHALERWRHLIGRASGPLLVELVVAAFNGILEASGCHAEQREEKYVEDFWIVGADGKDIALSEAKGQGGGIARENVSQVDSHREQLQMPDEFPGLLVVNTFRNTDNLARKSDDVAPNVITRAVQQNVVVMRSLDLYNLLGMQLDGEDAATPLLEALRAPHGGWLRVADGTVEFRS
jgi:hypothetical protein